MTQSSGTYTLTTYPWGRAQRQVLKQAISPAMWYGMWLVPIVSGVWIAMCIVAPRFALIFGDPTPAIVGGFGAIAFLLMARKRNAGLRVAFNASAFRAGNWRAATADDGLHITSENVRQVFGWHAITEVRDGPDGMLVMLGPTVFLPVPASAFGDRAEYVPFRAEVDARIAAAKGAL
jgi:hypothetical protein